MDFCTATSETSNANALLRFWVFSNRTTEIVFFYLVALSTLSLKTQTPAKRRKNQTNNEIKTSRSIFFLQANILDEDENTARRTSEVRNENRFTFTGATAVRFSRGLLVRHCTAVRF